MKTFPKPLSIQEEREYLKRYKEGDLEAREVLINRNLRLVAHVIKKYQQTGYDMDDLLSVGTIGLIKAVNTFNVEKGSRLATWRMLSSHGCVYGSKPVSPEPKRTEMAYFGTGIREYVYPLLCFGRLRKVCTYVYP